ncbi:MAG: hypothetical protein NNA20_05610 [Nitrospira sp.]|nr:hypothetical protein [Nitrospira sp.]MCP9442051.1 hypothetical protein [Nitrospira sp.]
MTVHGLIESCIARLHAEQKRVIEAGQDTLVTVPPGRLVRTSGGLHLYEFIVPSEIAFPIDVAVAIVPSDETEPTEGLVLSQTGRTLLLQVAEALGDPVPSVTLIPDLAGHLKIAADRLEDMIKKGEAYNLGLAERLVPLFQEGERSGRRIPPESSALTMVWLEDRLLRRQRLAELTVDLVRANKRVLLLSPDHRESDQATGLIARALKAAGLSYQTLISRYEAPLLGESSGVSLQELGFEAQVRRFYAKSQSEKASLRRKYERFRELTPLMTAKAQKQKDLDEVRLLEWRLVSQMRDLQAQLADVETTLIQYESLPLFQRLAMQAVGKNSESLDQYRRLYQRQMETLRKEIDLAQARIRELAPEAAVSRDLKQEYDELKETVTKLGGAKNIRELLAAEADPNRQAFLQHRRFVAATAARVAGDPLFGRVRFDVLIVDEAPRIGVVHLLAAAGLARERLVLSGDPNELDSTGQWAISEPYGYPTHPPTPQALA